MAEVFLLASAVVGVLLVITLAGRHQPKTSALAAWNKDPRFDIAAEALALEHAPRGQQRGDVLRGQCDGYSIEVVREHLSSDTSLRLWGLEGPVVHASVQPLPVRTGSGPLPGAVVPALTKLATVAMDTPSQVASLDAPGRRALARAVRDHGVSLARGELHCELDLTALGAGDLEARVRGLVSLAQTIDTPNVSALTRMLRLAQDDPSADIRDRAARALVQTWPASPEARLVARQVLGAEDAPLALTAAMLVPGDPAATRTLVRLASAVGLTSQQRLQVAELLAETRPDQAVRIARNLAGQQRLAVEARSAALELLREHGTLAEVATLLHIRDDGPKDLSALADVAILAIQDRLSGAAAGALTVAESDDDAGGLAVTDNTERGALAVEPDRS